MAGQARPFAAWGFAITASLAAGASLADKPGLPAGTPPAGPATAAPTMPKREQDLIKILFDARKDYLSGKATGTPQAIRVDMQIKVLSFMRESQSAQDWIGLVKSRGTTPSGNGWVVIEIADGVTVATWQTDQADVNASTTFKPHSALFKTGQALRIGQPVTFSGTFLKAVIGTDDQMIRSPQFIARFSTLTPAPSTAPGPVQPAAR